MGSSRRIGRTILVTLGILAAVAAAAMAVAPIKGATYHAQIRRLYKGKLVTTVPFSFTVSKNGRKVGDFVFTHFYPVYCQGGGFGSPQRRSSAVSKHGTFEVKLPLYFAPAHQNQGNLIVRGTFGRHGAVSGTVTTAFTTAKVCNGRSKFSGVG